MKKYFLASLVALGTLFSCSSDDDSSSSQDPIIGTWKFVAEYENDDLVESDVCGMEDTFIFQANGLMTSQLYWDAEIEGECSHVRTTQSEWKNEGGAYYLKYVSITDVETGVTTEEDNEEFELLDITFSDDNNQFEVVYEDEDNGVTTTYKDVYQRQ